MHVFQKYGYSYCENCLLAPAQAGLTPHTRVGGFFSVGWVCQVVIARRRVFCVQGLVLRRSAPNVLHSHVCRNLHENGPRAQTRQPIGNFAVYGARGLKCPVDSRCFFFFLKTRVLWKVYMHCSFLFVSILQTDHLHLDTDHDNIQNAQPLRTAQ